MGKQRVLTDGQPQVLAPAPDVTNLSTCERGGEVIGTCQMAPRGPRMEHLYAVDPAPADMPLQAKPDALHLWQLWHRGLLGILAKPGAACW